MITEITIKTNNEHSDFEKLKHLYEYTLSLNIHVYGIERILKEIKLNMEMAEKDLYVDIGKDVYSKMNKEIKK